MATRQHSGSSIMKLFVVLMSLSTLGFGFVALFLFIAQSKYGEVLLIEQRAFAKLEEETRDPANIHYHGKVKSEAATTGRELPEYLSACARLTGVIGNVEGTDAKTERKRDYFENRVTYKLKNITIADLIRFLVRVQGKKEDVHLKSLKLSKFDYKVEPPTCSAQATFYVFSEKE